MNNKAESTAEAVLPIALFLAPDGEIMTPLTRSNAWTPSLWKIPGGGVEPGETLEQAAQREFLEEVGLYVGGLKTFKKITKPSRDPMHKEHSQYVMVGELLSISGFQSRSMDGVEALTNEMFNIKRIRSAIKHQGLLAHYDILPYHVRILKEVFDHLFGPF